jgi:hypothetical protein
MGNKNMINEVSITAFTKTFSEVGMSYLRIQLPSKQMRDVGINTKRLVEFSIDGVLLSLKLSDNKKKGEESAYITASYHVNIPFSKAPAFLQLNLPTKCKRLPFVVIDDALVIDLSEFKAKPTFAKLEVKQEIKPEIKGQVKKVASFAGLAKIFGK